MTRITDPRLLKWHTPRFDLEGAEAQATLLGRSFATSVIQDLVAAGIHDHSDQAALLAADARFEADTKAWLTKISDDIGQLNATSAQTAAVLVAFCQAVRARLDGGPQ